MPNTKANDEKDEKDPLDQLTKSLKNNFEVLEKLRARRKEIKTELSRDLLDEDDESRLAIELFRVSCTIGGLERHRKQLYDNLGALMPGVPRVVEDEKTK